MIQAAAPIFTVILASRMDVTQRVTGPRLIGVGVGFVGVALLVGVQRGGDLVAALAVLGVALCYAASVLFAGLTVRSDPAAPGVDRPALLRRDHDRAVRPHPAARRRRRRRRCGSPSLALGVLGSGIAYLLYFAIIASAGASRAILVTYLVPAFALAYGAVFLDEAITATALAGLALVLAGTALATGLVRRARVRLASEHDAAGTGRSSSRSPPLWGASYLFIKVGVDGGFSPGALMTARTLIAGAVLFAYLMATIGARTAVVRLREAWREAIALGVPQRRRSRSGSSPGASSTSTRAQRESPRRRCRSSRC